ncbi:hypothetical protein [Haloplanus pelagicus]|uniref:hypothetical protein n=1 Tax=Haloplanus pelagicus TaxID=2949995 RepID=UPI00203E13F9|nr:hypothetical protein [Haloplanus sp. HW8-1]
MLDPVSAVAGVTITGVTASTLYAAYLRGVRDATDPNHIIDVREVENYHAEAARAEAIRESVDATTEGSA